MLMAISILAALYQRNTTGKGRRLQVAMQDAQLNYTRGAFINHARTGEPQERGARRVRPAGAAERHLPVQAAAARTTGSTSSTATTTRSTGAGCARSSAATDLADDPEYLDRDKRLAHADEVNAMVAAWTRQHDKHEAMRILGAAGIPAGAVLDTGDLLAEPTFESRGIIQTQQHPSGELRMPTFPVRFDGKPPKIAPAPLLGEHTNEVFGDWLGMSEGDVEGLKDDGVI